MSSVTLLATGGTIATRTDAHGNAVAQASGRDLVEGLALHDGLTVHVEDVFTLGGYLMTLPRMHELASRARHHLADPEVDVVVEGSVVVSRVGGTKPTLVAASGFDGHPDTARPEPTAAITKAPNRIA